MLWPKRTRLAVSRSADISGLQWKACLGLGILAISHALSTSTPDVTWLLAPHEKTQDCSPLRLFTCSSLLLASTELALFFSWLSSSLPVFHMVTNQGDKPMFSFTCKYTRVKYTASNNEHSIMITTFADINNCPKLFWARESVLCIIIMTRVQRSRTMRTPRGTFASPVTWVMQLECEIGISECQSNPSRSGNRKPTFSARPVWEVSSWSTLYMMVPVLVSSYQLEQKQRWWTIYIPCCRALYCQWIFYLKNTYGRAAFLLQLTSTNKIFVNGLWAWWVKKIDTLYWQDFFFMFLACLEFGHGW